MVGTIALSSCNPLNKMKSASTDVSYNVSPTPLEMHAEQVDVSIDVKYPPKYFAKKAVVILTPVLTYEGGETTFDPVTVQGESVEENNKVIKNAEGGSVSYSGSVEYAESMRMSDLMIRAEAYVAGKEDNKVDLGSIKIAEGVVATANLVRTDPRPVMVADKFQRITEDSYKADIHYIINKANVRGSELKNEDIQKLEEYIESASKEERKALEGVKISAYASPDGPLDFNDKLSEDRQASAKRYLERQLKKAEVNKADQEEFWTLMSTAEDWEGFKELVQESDIQDKDLILRVLSMYDDPQVREREIKNMSATYEVLADEILPELRRSKLIANVKKTGLSDEEIMSIFESNPDSLGMEEILYAATLTDNLEKKQAIYQKASENYPNCFRAKNNLGYVYVKMDQPAEAKQAFEAAQELKDNDVIKNNLGAVALMQGDEEKAEELFTSGMGAGEAASYNLGIINIKKANYEAAINYFGNEPSYNLALAQILNTQTDAALTTLGNVEEQEDAGVYYLKAIVGARTDNTEMLFNNLRGAVRVDSSLKESAKTDMEFAEYFENETFQSIVE